MGDADWRGVEVLLILIPGVISPLTFLFKWISFKLFLDGINPIPLTHIAGAAFLESVTPLVAIFSALLIRLLSGLLFHNDFSQSWDIHVLFCLCLWNYLVNKVSIANIVNRYQNHTFILIALSVIATAVYRLTWLVVESILKGALTY
jgi:hypothetical protein